MIRAAWIGAGCFSVCLFALSRFTHADLQKSSNQDNLKVSIAIPELRSGTDLATPRKRIFPFLRYGRRPSDLPRFSVIVENVGNTPLQVWAPGNSWGDSVLSVEITTQDGKKIIARKSPGSYYRNFEETVRLLPGEMHVSDILYSSDEWTGFPTPDGSQSRTCTLKAVWQQSSAESQKKSPEQWFGIAESLPVEVAY